ncbi:MAG: hypothetical protein R3F20_02445 [Planctomycetota bacterium]
MTCSWCRFVDQSPFRQYAGSEEKKAARQAFVDMLLARWTIDGESMAPPSHGELVRLDPGLLVEPPEGCEVGYVPIVTRQEAAR